MATLNELAYNVLNKYSGGRSTNNEFVSLEQIKFNINYYRSLILHRDLRRSQNKHLFEQTIAVEVTEDTMFDFKLKESIPSIIQFNYEYPLSVRKQTKTFPVENYHRAVFNEYNFFTGNKTRFFIKGNDIYIYGEEDLVDNDEIEITGIFENPSEVHIFNGIDPLHADDQQYPSSGDINQRVCESLINGTFQIIKQAPPDVEVDTIPPIR